MRKVIKVAAILTVVAALITFAWQRVRRARGRWRGLAYRVSGHRPDPDVDDRTLADRVRSTIGPLEKRLDLPHVHVMVENHVVHLHGDVGWPHEAATLERAVRSIAGVRGVRSHLHVGLLRSDTRPSVGRRAQAHASG